MPFPHFLHLFPVVDVMGRTNESHFFKSEEIITSSIMVSLVVEIF